VGPAATVPIEVSELVVTENEAMFPVELPLTDSFAI
jgi:hypothetical protein